ncbi:RIP metalloprotease RseP [Hymenobacter sp. BT559]|uniref:RIP metalloprotease RseP n=1 Tax=Hymenobacter sp. BT559 TaxID=2795729 RepID=UPI0018ED47FA|nr:RIP metalloprotease RseP [Hymenobacter sp. BT559]MBJ6142578.1 RIP metalloprotease RseP [Hymenobacter sp. BT559]
MEILVMIGQLVLGLSLLVGLHEFGHFAFAKLFKIKVTKFYIFFDFLFPLPNVLNFSLLKKKVGETEYGIGWFPLGGYVAIHGMVDETQDADALAGPPQPDEFRAKPAWQRLLVMLGGIIMNIITGIVIFTLLTYKTGEEYLPASQAKFGIVTNGLGRSLGFRTGDQVVKINGRPFNEFSDIYDPNVLISTDTYYTVERNGELIDLPKLPKTFFNAYTKQMADDSIFISPRQPFTVKELVPGKPAVKAGIKAGDRITQIGSTPIRFFDELQSTVAQHKGQTLPFTINRNGQSLTLPVAVNEAGKIGLGPKSELKLDRHFYSLPQSVPRGTEKAFGVITLQAKAFTKMARREMSIGDNLGGPVEIAQQFGGDTTRPDFWTHFWTLVGMLSMVLAFMNLLPIPALDGGHVLFLLYEMILRRKPSDKFLENAQRVGTLLILALMFYVIIVKQVAKLF